jgi:hypothetical protein
MAPNSLMTRRRLQILAYFATIVSAQGPPDFRPTRTRPSPAAAEATSGAPLAAAGSFRLYRPPRWRPAPAAMNT